jgi:hypothetical protein
VGAESACPHPTDASASHAAMAQIFSSMRHRLFVWVRRSEMDMLQRWILVYLLLRDDMS